MIKWLDQVFKEGIFEGPFRHAVLWCDGHLSCNNKFNQLVKARLGISSKDKAPIWSSEFYQILSLTFALVLLIVASISHIWLSYLSAALALYRPFEIMVFAMGWVFAPKDPIHSYRRSLAGFVVNIVEVVIFFAAAYIGFDFVRGCSSILTAIYSSARIAVTIGPFKSAEPPESLFGGILIMAQITVSYFLVIVVIASIIGALRREQAQRDVPVNCPKMSSR